MHSKNTVDHGTQHNQPWFVLPFDGERVIPMIIAMNGWIVRAPKNTSLGMRFNGCKARIIQNGRKRRGILINCDNPEISIHR